MPAEADALTVELAGPQTWQGLLEPAVAGLGGKRPGSRLYELSETLLTMFHDRHVGITPELAAGLAYLLVEREGQTTAPPPWSAVIKRLRRELRQDEAGRAGGALSAERQAGFLLREAPSYTLMRLALPLVARACRTIGRSVLFCAEEVAGGVAPRPYARYAEELRAAVLELADSDLRTDALPDEDAPFWAGAALSLSSRALTQEPGAPPPPIPEVDPVELGWLLRLRPDPEPRTQSSAPPRVMTTPLKRQKSRRLHEGGVTGYRMTRRMEDLDEIVLSELLYPETVFYDRVLNSGYLVVERPPRHQKRRDVLAVGMLPPGLDGSPAAGLLKACWFDCMWRFSAFLRSQDLLRSELRWIEGDGPDRARHASYLLGELPGLGADPNPAPAERQLFMRVLRWVPSFLTRRDRPTALRLPPTTQAPRRPEEALPPEAAWLRAAWEAQRENSRVELGASTLARPRSWPDAVAEFAHAHLMIFLPAEGLAALGDEQRTAAIRLHRRLLGLFRLSASAGAYLSLTFVPRQPLRPADWLVVTASGARGLEGAEATPEAIAGAVERIWLDHLIKDMCRG